jgi:hypothetical protein
MGYFTSDEEGHVESIVYFLTEALRAAVENGDSVHQSLCEAPQLSPNMNCGEIADRLAAYRRHSRAIWSYEALMVAKIMRARELAKELRALDAELRPELDIFRLATVSSSDLQDLMLPNAQNLFHGVDQYGFGDDRGASLFDGVKADPLAGYRIAGHTDMSLLLGACEALHYALAARYGLEPMPTRFATGGAIMEEPLLLEETIDETDEAFLLTDFCEILPESLIPAPGTEWRTIHMGNGGGLPN